MKLKNWYKHSMELIESVKFRFKKNKAHSDDGIDLSSLYHLPVITPSIISLSVAVFLFLFILVLWAFFGFIPITLKGKGVILAKSGLFNVQAKLKGTISHIQVKTGDFVKKGDLLLEIDDPQLDFKLQSAQARVQTLEMQLEQLHKQITDEQTAQRQGLGSQIVANQFHISQVEDEVNFLTAEIQRFQELLKKGLITLSYFRSEEEKLTQKQIELEETRGKLAALQAEIQKEFRPEELKNKEQQLIADTEERNLLQVAKEQGKIYSPYNGHVLEIMANVGDLVQTGYPLMWIENVLASEQTTYLIYSYFPVDMGKRIHEGMPAEMTLSSEIQNQYGAIKGKVKVVSLFAASQENIFNTIQNKALISYLLNQNTAVVEVIIQPDDDPRHPNQFVWTSGLEPSFSIATGTVGDVEVTVEKVRPIFYLLPLPSLKHY